MNKTNVAVGALLALGLLQMVADRLGITSLKAIASATAASPAPKVFSVANGLETYSTAFYVEWDDAKGRHSVELTPELNDRFRGPYNRRNIYGAALAYGPVLAVNPHTKPMLDDVLRSALCGEAPLLREIGLAPDGLRQPVCVRYEPRQNPEHLPMLLEAPCRN